MNQRQDLDFKADQLTPSLVPSHKTTKSLSFYKKWALEEIITDLQGPTTFFQFLCLSNSIGWSSHEQLYEGVEKIRYDCISQDKVGYTAVTNNPQISVA